MKILVTDDDEALRTGLVENLRLEGWQVDSAPDAATSLEKLGGVDLLVTDIRLPDMDGLELLSRSLQQRSGLEIIVMTGYSSISSVVDAMRRGARTYIAKPFDPEELILHVREVDRHLRAQEAALRAGRGDLAGISSPMKHVYAQIDAAAASMAPVMITGETGTGKECAAHAIHDLSAHRRGPFVPVNLGALPRDLIESELFGHERGAFTGAHAKTRGRFFVAAQGTLFLDEVDSLPLELQPKLLRAIETREVWPLGAEQASKTDVRIISATNARVEELVKNQKFREDLYYRLNVLRVEMPPLRQRPEDIPGIVRVLLDRMQRSRQLGHDENDNNGNDAHGTGQGGDRRHGARLGQSGGGGFHPELTAEALSLLMTKRWPGNVRELANALERGLARATAARSGLANTDLSVRQASGRETQARAVTIGPQDIDPDSSNDPEMSFRLAKDEAVEKWTRSTIASALARTEGNVSQAARKLQMSRTFLLSLIKKYRIRE